MTTRKNQMETKLAILGEPVVIIGILRKEVEYITRPLIIQVKVMYQDGSTGYVKPEMIDTLDESIDFFAKRRK